MADWRSPFDHVADGFVDESAAPKWRTWHDASVALGRCRRVDGDLVMSVSPGEWIVIGDRPDGDDVVDITHVRAALRIIGADAAAQLARVCALDFGDEAMPNGSAARTLVAGVATEIVRDDVDGMPSYLLLMSRSFARSVHERLAGDGDAR